MGAWGLRLFQPDYDYDTIKYLSLQAGLEKLEAEAGGAAVDKDLATTRRSEHGNATSTSGVKSTVFRFFPVMFFGKVDDSKLNYSLYAPLCSDIEGVRNHLDSGVVDEMMAQFRRKNVSLKKADLNHRPESDLSARHSRCLCHDSGRCADGQGDESDSERVHQNRSSPGCSDSDEGSPRAEDSVQERHPVKLR